jgi:hypothetical protein
MLIEKFPIRQEKWLHHHIILELTKRKKDTLVPFSRHNNCY